MRRTRSAAAFLLAGIVVGCAPNPAGPGRNVAPSATEPVAPEPGQASIRLNQEQAPAHFEISGLDPKGVAQFTAGNADRWTELFAVYVDSGKGDPTARPPMLGSYRVENDVLRFEPRFPLERGVRYRAVLNPSRLNGTSREPVVAEFLIPRPNATPTTVVEHVYPTTGKLPENQLKFYLHFSAPMSRGEAYRHIHLLDAAGTEVDLPFLELDEELWDPQGRRFTLFFDPGRIKRGLKPREEVGPALEEGKSYTLVLDADWADADGNPLKEAHRKAFRVGPPDDQLIDPKMWKVEAAPADSVQPLAVTFTKPLDHAMLHRVLWVVDAADRRVAGSVSVTKEETRWEFTPQQPWQRGSYQLVVDTALEDLAGNSIGKPFEVDVFHPVQKSVEAKTVGLPFAVAR